MPPSSQGFASRDFLISTGVILVVLAVLGWSAYQKVRASSEDKAVLCPVRMLAAAADQYYLENGVSMVEYRQLVGATNYIKSIQTVAGETYPAFYTRGITITVTGIAGVRTITYAP
jgi:type IV pilus assembly protein PilA